MSRLVEYNDLISMGYYGLCKAAVGFDSNKNNYFSTYAVTTIVRTIQRELLPYSRHKRGSGCTIYSLDDMIDNGYEIDQDSSLVDNTDVEEIAINRVVCSKVWKLVPTFRAVDQSGMSCREFAKCIGMPTSSLFAKKNKELKKARRVLEGNDLKGSVSA
jgi:hypothetical protein